MQSHRLHPLASTRPPGPPDPFWRLFARLTALTWGLAGGAVLAAALFGP